MTSSGAPGADGADDNGVLQAVVLADSFNTRFKPLTANKPRCLLPICGATLLEWTFESLVLAGVQEIFVVCRSHADLIQDAIANSKYNNNNPNNSSCSSSSSGIRIKPIITAQETFAPGDALRDIYTHGIITSDFVLVSGDLVSSVDIDQAVKLHKQRRKTNKDTIMTMVVRECGGQHPTRPRGDAGLFILDPSTSECLHYEHIIASPAKRHFTIPREVLQEHREIEIRNDLLDCAIDVCSIEVPSLFQDNFDYLDIRRDFVHGILTSDLLNRNIYCHVVKEGYAGRVKDTKTYEAVSQDILSRWTFPLVPDANYPGEIKYRNLSGNRYVPIDGSVKLSKTSKLGPNTLIGPLTELEEGTEVTRSTIGRKVKIGAGTVIKGSHVLNGCRIGKGCRIESSMLGENVRVGEGCVVPKGCRIGDGVILSGGTRLEAFSRVSRTRLDDRVHKTLANGGTGFVWPEPSSEEEEGTDEVESVANQQFLVIGREEDEDEDDDDADEEDDESESERETPTAGPMGANAGEQEFLAECTASVERAFEEGHTVDNAAVELKTLRMASNVGLGQVRSVVIRRMMEWIVRRAGGEPGRIGNETKKMVERWGGLITAIGGANGVETLDILEETSREGEEKKRLFGHMVMGLYNMDVIEEGEMREWYGEGREGYCGEVVSRLLARLEETSSESE